MPGGDGTGPLGRGPRTGRGLGFCAGFDKPGYANSESDYGRGWGHGRGMHHRHRWGWRGGRGCDNWYDKDYKE